MDREGQQAVRQTLDAINSRTLQDRAAELLDPSLKRHDLAQLFPDGGSSSDGSDFVAMIAAAMPDLRLDIEDIFGAADRVAVRLRITGTHTGAPLLGRAATGQRLASNAVFIYRVRGGRIAEAWQMIDGLAFFRVVGLLG